MANSGAATGRKATGSATKRSSSSWTISGVSKRTRDAVARAAKKDEVPIGAWVDRTLRDAAETRLKGGPPGLALPGELLDTLNDLSQSVKELNERRSFAGQTLQQVQETASELGDQVSSTYEALVKRADPAFDQFRTWTDETFEEAAKWGNSLIEPLRNAANGIERLQHAVLGQESAKGKTQRTEKSSPATKPSAATKGARAKPARGTGRTKPKST